MKFVFTVDKTYDDFVERLKEAETNNQCRYAVYDAAYVAESGANSNKLIMITW